MWMTSKHVGFSRDNKKRNNAYIPICREMRNEKPVYIPLRHIILMIHQSAPHLFRNRFPKQCFVYVCDVSAAFWAVLGISLGPCIWAHSYKMYTISLQNTYEICEMRAKKSWFSIRWQVPLANGHREWPKVVFVMWRYTYTHTHTCIHIEMIYLC